jgi:hypothetical protein
LTPERIEFHLLNWADWMESENQKLSYPSKSAGFVGGGYNTDFDTMCETSDVRCAEAVDAIIECLPINQKVAINHCYCTAVYRIRNQDEVLNQAKLTIGKQLDARGII